MWRGAAYDIEVVTPEHVCRGVRTILAGGKETESIPSLPAGARMDVKIIMG